MENNVVVLLLSVVILIGAFYGYTVEQNIHQIKNHLPKHEKEIKEVRVELESTRKELKEVKVEFESTRKELKQSQVELESSRNAFNKVKVDSVSMEKDFIKAQLELESSRNAFNKVKVDLVSTKEQINILRKEMIEKENACRKEINQIKADVITSSEELNKIKTGASSSHAFYAYLSHDLPEPGGNRHFVYNTVMTNIGNAYNELTGTFTVPRNGIYSFTWSTRVACSKAHTTELVLNTRVLGSTYIWCGYNTVTGHVVTYASQGETVFVRTHSSPGQGAIKSNNSGRSAFSGFLIS